jgi:ferric-dicitrate binding protein FerR (iron transport regulator)
MEQSQFQNILKKYLRGKATEEEKKIIDRWYAAMGVDVDAHNISDGQSNKLNWSVIRAHIARSKKSDRSKNSLTWYTVGIAAAVTALVVSSLVYINYSPVEAQVWSSDNNQIVWNEITNTTNSSRVFILPDSSNITLEPNSRLRYSSSFNTTQREVYLRGEALFEVKHNKALPFLVFANEVTTKVLGTSFIVKAFESEKKITVSVKTGKVSVYANKRETASAEDEIILTPNQQIVYDKEEKEISKMLVQAPELVLPKEEVRRMRFEEAPVTEIFKALEKAYGVDIEFDEETFSSCELTTVISDDDIYRRLDIICNAIGTSYSLKDDRIVIQSAGCKAKI